MQDIFNSGPLNLTYAGVLGVSFLFALISLIGSDVGDGLDFDIDADGGADGLDFVSLSPFAIAMFGAAFGFVGLLTRIAFEMSQARSLLWAGLAGLIIGAGAQLVFLYVLSPTTTSHVNLKDDAIGRAVDVIVTIPGKGKGTIAYDNKTGRVTMGAISATGRKINTGESVIIEKVVGQVAYVRLPNDDNHNGS